MPLSPIGHLLHKTVLPRLGNVVGLCNTQKQLETGNQNGETKKHTPNERIGEIPRKKNKTNYNGISNLQDTELKTMVITRTGVAQLDWCYLADQWVTDSIPGQGTCLGYGFSPPSGHRKEATNQCFSHTSMFFSLSSPLSRINIRKF